MGPAARRGGRASQCCPSLGGSAVVSRMARTTAGPAAQSADGFSPHGGHCKSRAQALMLISARPAQPRAFPNHLRRLIFTGGMTPELRGIKRKQAHAAPRVGGRGSRNREDSRGSRFLRIKQERLAAVLGLTQVQKNHPSCGCWEAGTLPGGRGSSKMSLCEPRSGLKPPALSFLTVPRLREACVKGLER